MNKGKRESRRQHRLLMSLGLLVIFVSTAPAQARIDRTDNQQWTDVQLAVPVTKQFDFNILGTLRLGRDLSHAVDERVGVGFTWRAGKYVTVSPKHYTQDFYYLRQNDGVSIPGDLNVIGTVLRFRL